MVDRFFKVALTVGFVLLSLNSLKAQEVIVTNPAQSSNDRRFEYPMVVLKEVLKRTQEQYGEVEVKRFSHSVSRARALREIKEGGISVFSTPTRPEWENQALPVRIPIRKGILGYKLGLIRDEHQDMFKNIRTIEDLRKLRMGGGAQWSSSLALRRMGFNVIGGIEYEPLFAMLNANRFDYFPRGVNEIFTEYENRIDKFPKLRIEKEIAIYLPQPTYFFVTPLKPDLAKRIEAGLVAMYQDGTLSKLFDDYHGEALKRADLANRRIIYIENKNLNPQTPLGRQELWYQPNK